MLNRKNCINSVINKRKESSFIIVPKIIEVQGEATWLAKHVHYDESNGRNDNEASSELEFITCCCKTNHHNQHHSGCPFPGWLGGFLSRLSFLILPVAHRFIGAFKSKMVRKISLIVWKVLYKKCNQVLNILKSVQSSLTSQKNGIFHKIKHGFTVPVQKSRVLVNH